MISQREIIATFEAIEAERGGPFLSDAKAVAEETAERLGLTYAEVRAALLMENGGLFG